MLFNIILSHVISKDNVTEDICMTEHRAQSNVNQLALRTVPTMLKLKCLYILHRRAGFFSLPTGSSDNLSLVLLDRYKNLHLAHLHASSKPAL